METTAETKKNQIKIYNTNHIPNKHNIKIFPLIMSQFGWAFLISTAFLSGFFFPKYHKPKKYTSKNADKEWNSDLKPIVFTHLTDLHLSHLKTPKTKKSIFVLREMAKYKADFNLITGDVVDNYEKINFPKYGIQVKKDYIFYRKIMRELFGNNTIIDLAGNHDEFAVDGLFAKNHLFLDYSYTFTRNKIIKFDDFYVKKIIIKNLTFILFNDFQFPVVSIYIFFLIKKIFLYNFIAPSSLWNNISYNKISIKFIRKNDRLF